MSTSKYTTIDIVPLHPVPLKVNCTSKALKCIWRPHYALLATISSAEALTRPVELQQLVVTMKVFIALQMYDCDYMCTRCS